MLQLGDAAQHAAILRLLSGAERGFQQGKVAYKPPGRALLTSVLDVARWVDKELGLAHAHVSACRGPQRLAHALPSLRDPSPSLRAWFRRAASFLPRSARCSSARGAPTRAAPNGRRPRRSASPPRRPRRPSRSRPRPR